MKKEYQKPDMEVWSFEDMPYTIVEISNGVSSGENTGFQ